jgi:hypothetical protein
VGAAGTSEAIERSCQLTENAPLAAEAADGTALIVEPATPGRPLER